MKTETTDSEWEQIVDESARLYLGIGADELRVRVTRGDTDDLNQDNLMRVLALLPASAR
jgi:hypothetical protein